jgi:hypothetical protein
MRRMLLILPVLLALTACGGPSATQAAATVNTVPQSVRTGRTLLIGGNELFDVLAKGLRAPHDFGDCADNAGVSGGDSTAMLGMFSLGVMNTNPARVIIVANAFELTYMGADTLQRNYYGMVLQSTVAGSRTVLVGVPGADEFDNMLRLLARSYGAEYVNTLDPAVCK